MAGYKDTSSSDAVYMLDWYAYGIGKVPTKVATTYQNISDAWSLLIDQKWHDRITAIKANDGGLSYVEFFEYRKNKMSIRCLTFTARPAPTVNTTPSAPI